MNTNKKILIQVIFEDTIQYVSEVYPYYTDSGLEFVSSIKDALSYSSHYEFLTALKYVRFNRTTRMKYDNFSELLDNAIFNIIDIQTLETKVIDIHEKISFDKTELTFEPAQFKSLQSCFYGSSHYLYNKEKWIAFPKQKDTITHIEYLKRGLISNIDTIFQYRNNNTPGCYSGMAQNNFTMFNEDILKLSLDTNVDSCDRINIFPKQITQ